jgi:putative membrane protein insertion efficiency factor
MSAPAGYAGRVPPAASAGRVARAAAVLLRGYKRFVSPVLPPACRFHPTCSEYAREAILRHGVTRGMGMALRRLGRCHPWNEGGVDPVP